MRAGEIAEAAGVNRETLRYYERRGLMPEPERSLGGHRLYDESAVVTLRVIKAAQRLGFTLDEVADLIEVGRPRCRDAGLQSRARAKLEEVEARMRDDHPRQPPRGPRRGLRRPARLRDRRVLPDPVRRARHRGVAMRQPRRRSKCGSGRVPTLERIDPWASSSR